jgi:hypothetical protein
MGKVLSVPTQMKPPQNPDAFVETNPFSIIEIDRTDFA